MNGANARRRKIGGIKDMLYELPDRLFGFLSVGLFNFPSGQLRCWLGLAHQSMRYSPLSSMEGGPPLFYYPQGTFLGCSDFDLSHLPGRRESD